MLKDLVRDLKIQVSKCKECIERRSIYFKLFRGSFEPKGAFNFQVHKITQRKGKGQENQFIIDSVKSRRIFDIYY